MEGKKKRKLHIVLMGDSVLDNFYWLENNNEDVANQLKSLYLYKKQKLVKVTNLALDETETHNIYEGKVPGLNYVNLRKKIGMEPYRVQIDGVFRPLIQLKKLIYCENQKEGFFDKCKNILFGEKKTKQKNLKKDYNKKKEQIEKISKPKFLKDRASHIILSIGGNDARTNLQFGTSKKILESLKKNNFVENYKKAISSIYKIIKKIVIVIVYRPGPGFYEMMEKKEIDKLYTRVVPLMLEIARDYKIPVIDLSRTFDPLDYSHYGSTPIEPSNKSGIFICEKIVKVLESFDFKGEESKVYYGLEKEVEEVNCNGYVYKLDC